MNDLAICAHLRPPITGTPPCPSDLLPEADEEAADAALEALAQITEDQDTLASHWADFIGWFAPKWHDPRKLCQPEVDVAALTVPDLHALLIHPDTPREALVPVLHELRARFESALRADAGVV